MLRLIRFLFPSDHWYLPVLIISGVLFGIFGYLLYVSNAVSYLSDKPEACVNCHIMTPQYSTWNHSSHRENANCNDCHVPHNNVFNKYYFKAKDGLRHASIFTQRKEPQVIFIKEEGQEVVQDNCMRCHSNLLTGAKETSVNHEFEHFRTDRKCWECHREVPHGRVNSLSSVPNARAPLPGSPVPAWLKAKMKR